MAEVEEIVARLRPRPAVPSRIRKMSSASPGSKPGENGLFVSEESSAGGPDRDVQEVGTSNSRRSDVSPLSPESYKIEFTGDAETVYVLRKLQDLLSHQVPNGDLAVIIKEALVERLKQVERKRFGKGKRSIPCAKTSDGVAGSSESAAGEKTQSRYIPLEIKNAVWERDQGHCAFVARNGRQCSERRWIEFHHVVPFAWGGESTVENIELRCRTHNAYEGELLFGKVIRKSKAWALPATTRFKTSGTTGTGSGTEVGTGG